jgi:carboxymethylenebutenolidase
MHDMQRYLVEEFAEDYLEGQISRRDLFRRVLLVTGSVAVTASALGALGVKSKQVEAAAPPRVSRRPAAAQNVALPDIRDDNGTMPPPQQTTDNVVSPDDPAIQASMVTYPGPMGDVIAYLAQPNDGDIHPMLIVVHENRGLIEPNMDIARRYAKEGYVALAPDLASAIGGTAAHMDDLTQVTGFLGQSNPDDLVSVLQAGLEYLATVPAAAGERFGVTGFCFGGGLAWRLAEAAPGMKAAVPYYGPNVPLDKATNINAAALGIYGELDTRVTGASDDLFTALAAAGKTAERWIAPNSMHAFFNNTGQAYNPAAAMEAWSRTLAWFAQYL